MSIRILSAFALVAPIWLSSGCSGKSGGGVVSKAEASAPPQQPGGMQYAGKEAEAKAADVLRKAAGADDDGEDRAPEKGEKGAKRWRDTGVYVDGQPKTVLSFGELPIGLKPTWKEEKAGAEIEPGSHAPGYKIIKQRYYRFDHLLQALGVDLKKVNEIHVYGPRFSETIVATGKDLRSKKGREFMFHFGGDVQGKAIPIVPDNFGNGKGPDKISAVMVYLEKTPPKLVWNQGLVLNGQVITNVPYFGDPIRGGVRVYQDDLLSMIIKRPLLRQSTAVSTDPDGTARYSLLQILKDNGIDISKVAEAWTIHTDRRREKLSRAELEKLTFFMGAKGQNEIFLGDKKLPATAIALHKKPLTDDQLPKILPEEEGL